MSRELSCGPLIKLELPNVPSKLFTVTHNYTDAIEAPYKADIINLLCPRTLHRHARGTSSVRLSFELWCASSTISITDTDSSHFTSCSAPSRMTAARLRNKLTYPPCSTEGNLCTTFYLQWGIV